MNASSRPGPGPVSTGVLCHRSPPTVPTPAGTAVVALVGMPNTGKSTSMNSSRKRSLVRAGPAPGFAGVRPRLLSQLRLFRPAKPASDAAAPMPAPIDAVPEGGPAKEALPSGDALQALEQVARREGSGLESADLAGLWWLERVWSRGQRQPTPLAGVALRALGASLRIEAEPDSGPDSGLDTGPKIPPGLKLTNAVKLGPLELRFQGPGWLEGRRPLLRFQFDRLEIRAGQWLLLQRSLPAPDPRRGAFFALIASGAEGRWLAARGRSGGLAVWRREG